MVALLSTVIVLVPGASATQAADPETFMLHGLRLERCDAVTGVGFVAWCGSLRRPLEPGRAPSLPIRFALTLPASASPGSSDLDAVLLRPLIAAFEGGPGYGGIDSGDAYAQMLGPLMTQRAMLVMDARGTGRSKAIDCPALQQQTKGYLKAARDCARQLGSSVDDFATALAADDAAALISRLGFPQADVYGDSYGTFMAQVLAGRHPEMIRSMVLDGAYPVTGETAWYPTQAPALRKALAQVCEGNRGCASESKGTVSRLAALLDRLRDKPMRVSAPGGDGVRHNVSVTPRDLFDVAFHGTYVDSTYRELDPAIRAALAGDPLPLGRLVAEFRYPDDWKEAARVNSVGQFLAVTCHDYPQLYDMSAPTSARRAQFKEAIARARATTPDLFAPFTIDEYLDSSWETVYDCLTWARLPREGSGPPAPPSGTYPDVPVLILSGSLDTITTTAEGDMVAAQFPRSRQVEVEYGVHVQAMGNTVPCAASMVRSFFEDPEGFGAADPPACSAPRPRLHESFARTSRGLDEGRAAMLTVADAINRVRGQWTEHGLGLRGGTWRASYVTDDEVAVTLDEVRFFEDLPVSGSATWVPSTGSVRAAITVPGGRITVTWSHAADDAMIRGVLNGERVVTRVNAP
jgi:pimeloyl-ACP methyl ester carboxylesterase